MAHIADYMLETSSMVGLNNYIARELSPNSPHDATTQVQTPPDEKEAFVWRMHQPTESRKYQLFPAKDKLSIGSGRKSPDAESLRLIAMGHSERDQSSLLRNVIRPKAKEPILNRRKKVSVPELGPMTTVQEVPMDSPTIPGRPPVHERSISAPGNGWRQHPFGENMLSCISSPALDAEGVPSDVTQSKKNSPIRKRRSTSPKEPLSPKTLAPLVIPGTTAAQPQRWMWESSLARLWPGSTPPEVPPKSARMTGGSPYSKSYLFTPMSASTTSLPITRAPIPIHSTPNSAPEGRSSPKPWSAGPSPHPAAMGHSRGQSETTQRVGHTMGHRRGESDASIMDRGRPKKRADGSPIKQASAVRIASIEEVKAFERLPQGYRATAASSLLPPSELEIIRKQALGQASRFEILRSKDVELLSREVRGLDERCEYLRKTHQSLRTGRRNLHERICTYLRSPRVARFSHESILKQEESLAELDSSIDDWVFKLEQAENRRTRVRQKLLEHVAAALILPPQTPTGQYTPPRSPTKSQSPPRLAAPLKPVERKTVTPSTPPRSPTKHHRPATPMLVTRPGQVGRCSVESIRIYADSDVYALLADVEDEINRMGEQVDTSHGAAVSAGLMLSAATFSPPKPVLKTSGGTFLHD